MTLSNASEAVPFDFVTPAVTLPTLYGCVTAMLKVVSTGFLLSPSSEMDNSTPYLPAVVSAPGKVNIPPLASARIHFLVLARLFHNRTHCGAIQGLSKTSVTLTFVVRSFPAFLLSQRETVLVQPYVHRLRLVAHDQHEAVPRQLV